MMRVRLPSAASRPPGLTTAIGLFAAIVVLLSALLLLIVLRSLVIPQAALRLPHLAIEPPEPLAEGRQA
jgi:hypothetical protein